MNSKLSGMGKDLIISWTIRSCDDEIFVGMGWWDREKGIFFLEWTREGSPGWVESDAARAWAEYKGHLKEKDPRDLKAGLRNAYRSKKDHLKKIKMPKSIAVRNGRKYMFWKILNLEFERQKMLKKASKSGQKKKSSNKKNQRDMVEMMIEDNIPHCSSTLSDSECKFPKPEKTHAKVGKEKPRKKRGQTKLVSNKQSGDSSEPLPPIESLKRSFGFKDAYQFPLQSQDISSTFTEDRFINIATECGSFPPTQLLSYPSGPTPPPQKTDVLMDDQCESSHISKSLNFLSQFLTQSDDGMESPHSISTPWDIPINKQFNNYQTLNQSDESSHSSHSCSPLLNIPSTNQFQNYHVLYHSDKGSHSPHFSSPISNISNPKHFQNGQVLNQSYEGSHSPLLHVSCPNQFQNDHVLKLSEKKSRNSPQYSSPTWLCTSHKITQALIQPDKMYDIMPLNAQPCFFSASDQIQDSVSQSQNIFDYQFCDNLHRVTTDGSYPDGSFVDSNIQFLLHATEDVSLFSDIMLTEIPLLENFQTEGILGFEASKAESEFFLDSSQLTTHNTSL